MEGEKVKTATGLVDGQLFKSLPRQLREEMMQEQPGEQEARKALEQQQAESAGQVKTGPDGRPLEQQQPEVLKVQPEGQQEQHTAEPKVKIAEPQPEEQPEQHDGELQATITQLERMTQSYKVLQGKYRVEVAQVAQENAELRRENAALKAAKEPPRSFAEQLPEAMRQKFKDQGYEGNDLEAIAQITMEAGKPQLDEIRKSKQQMVDNAVATNFRLFSGGALGLSDVAGQPLFEEALDGFGDGRRTAREIREAALVSGDAETAARVQLDVARMMIANGDWIGSVPASMRQASPAPAASESRTVAPHKAPASPAHTSQRSLTQIEKEMTEAVATYSKNPKQENYDRVKKLENEHKQLVAKHSIKT